MSNVAPSAPSAQAAGAPSAPSDLSSGPLSDNNKSLDGSEMSKGAPDTQPVVGIDYSLFSAQGSADGSTGAGVGGVGMRRGGPVRYADGGTVAPVAPIAGEDRKKQQSSGDTYSQQTTQSGNPNDYIGQWAYDLSQGNMDGLLRGPGMRALEKGDVMSAISPAKLVMSGMSHGGPVHDNHRMAQHLAAQGRGRDTTLVHMSGPEVRGLGSLHPSGKMPINPKTGLPEADFLTDILPGIAGTVVGSVVGMPWLGAAVGGLGTWAATGNLGKGILSGLMSFGLGSIGGQLASAGEAATQAGAKGAEDLVAKTAEGAAQGAGQTAATPLNPATFPSTSAIDRAIDPSLGSVAGNVKPPTTPGFFDRISQGFQNAPQTMSNIGQGIMNPQNLDMSKMIMPGIMAGSGAMGLAQANQQPAQLPNPMAQQQGQYHGTPNPVPFRTPTGGVVPQGQNPQGYQGELSYFAPNPAYSVYAAEGGLMPSGISYELAKGGVANLPSGMIRGPGGGMDDQIKGTIDGRRDVYLSDGEYVVDAQTISALGDGSSEAGAKRMGKIVKDIRQKKFGSTKQPDKMASHGGLASLGIS